MKKTILMAWINIILSAVLFCIVSCEKPEINPEQSDEPTTSSDTSSTDKIVGTWVKCGGTFASNEEPNCLWESSRDTITFSEDGIFQYITGNYNEGEHHVEEFYFEYMKHYLILYNNPSSYAHRTYHIKFNDEGTQLKIFSWNFYNSSVHTSELCNVCFKKVY